VALAAGLLSCALGVGISAPASAKDCGNVPAHGSCDTGYWQTGQSRAVQFFLYNGSGVQHCAWLYDTFGCGTQQYVYSGCVSLNQSLKGAGSNESNSAHHYGIYWVVDPYC
jgi:hypothetical protein